MPAAANSSMSTGVVNCFTRASVPTSGTVQSSVFAPREAGQMSAAVFLPASLARSYTVGALTSSSLLNTGSTTRGTICPVARSSTLFPSTPCFAGETPVTSVVWFGQVTLGMEAIIPSARAPWAAISRRQGISARESSR